MEYRAAVVAEKFELKTRKDNKWDINCPARESKGKMVQTTEHIEHINSVDNNIHFVIDERETKKYLENLEIRIARAKENDQVQKMSAADVLRHITQTKIEQMPVKEDKSEIIKELKAKCDELGIEYAKNAGVAKLNKLIEEFEN